MKRRDFALLTLAPLAAPVWARNPAFAPLTERFLEALWQMDPDAAVAAGRFEFAGRLTLPSAAQRQRMQAFLGQWQRTFEAVPEASLSVSDRMDRALLLGKIRSDLWRLDTLREWAWNPAEHNPASPIDLILNTDWAPVQERVKALQPRLRQLPAFYAEARKSLSGVTREHTELALQQAPGVLAVLPVALLQAVLSITLRANQIVTGVGINILVLGATTLAYRELFGGRSRAEIPGLAKWAPPGLADIPLLGEHVFQQTWLLYAGLVVVALIAWMMRHTALGLSLHAAGAAPKAVDKSGLSVTAIRYGAVMLTGVMSALAGCFLSIGDIHTFTEGMTNGAGYLAIAAVIFGNWRIGRMLGACLLFGAATALQFQLPAFGIQVPSAVLIMLPYLLALLAVGGLVGRQTAPAYLTQAYVR